MGSTIQEEEEEDEDKEEMEEESLPENKRPSKETLELM